MFIGAAEQAQSHVGDGEAPRDLGKKKERLRGSRFWANTGQTGHVGVGVARLAIRRTELVGSSPTGDLHGPTHQPPFALPPRCPNPRSQLRTTLLQIKSPRDQNLLTPFQKG